MTLLEPGQEITATVVRDSLDGSVAIMVELPRSVWEGDECVPRAYSWQDIADIASVYPKALINGRPLSVRCCSTHEQMCRNEVTLIVEVAKSAPLSMEEADIVTSGMLEPTTGVPSQP